MPSGPDAVWRRLTGFALLTAAGWVAARAHHREMGGVRPLTYPASTFLCGAGDRSVDQTARSP